MKRFKITKETIALIFITILSAIINLGNLSIEGTGNVYYAAAVKSMTMNFKNFFFVAFDPSGFVSIDKPPLGFWLQAVSAKIFGYRGWSIILPQALAGVVSVVLIYFIVKRSFGKVAGLISSLCLAVTPVFVAASRNNTVDNVLLSFLLLGCWALIIAAEKGKFKYLALCMVFVGLGFNVKMLEAYMVIPAIYITYLFTTSISLKKRIAHLAAGSLVLAAVSLSWALVVDSIPASSRPYVDSSSNNTVMDLILGHNGIRRLSFDNMNGGPGRGPNMPKLSGKDSNNNIPYDIEGNIQGEQSGMPGGPDGIPGIPGGNSRLKGTFGNEVSSGISRLFTKSILSDQIVWFIILAVLGFIASAIKEKLSFKLNNTKKQSLALWIMWFVPVFLYFSYSKGLFHPYYLTMLAAPIAAMTGIGIVAMWELYIEGGWKSWFLPVSLIVNGAVQLLMLTYFIDDSAIVKILLVLLIILCFGASIILSILNAIKKVMYNREVNIYQFKKVLVSVAMAGLLIIPFTGSAAAMFTGVGSSIPSAGLELLTKQDEKSMMVGMFGGSDSNLTDYLLKNKTSSQKYLLAVGSSMEAAEIVVETGEPIMSLGGFSGRNNAITLEEFIELVKNGNIRYVMAGGFGGLLDGDSKGTVAEIMNWVKENGKVVLASDYSKTDTSKGNMDNNGNPNGSQSQTYESNDSNQNWNPGQFGGPGHGQQLYDLKAYTD